MKAHKHAELIKAWADGAKIQEWFNGDEVIEGHWTNLGENIAWQYHVDNILRIKPDCEYAIEKIRELGGDEAVEVYEYWLGGGEIEQSGSGYYSDYIQVNDKNREDPLGNFICALAGLKLRFRKKKKTVKQVLWVSDSNAALIPQSCNKVYADWFEDGFDPNNEMELMFRRHKVPTCTREVEL